MISQGYSLELCLSRSDCGFSTRVGSKLVTEQSVACESTVLDVRVEVVAVTAALGWLSGVNVTRVIVVTDAYNSKWMCMA